ncbi:MAG: HupE/UreJ family protein [Pseudomonadota bacterium]
MRIPGGKALLRKLFAACVILCATVVEGHALDPLVMSITGSDVLGEATLSWRVSNARYIPGTRPEMPSCVGSSPRVLRVPPSVIVRLRVRCPEGLTGSRVVMPTTIGPEVETFIDMDIDGVATSMVLSSDRTHFEIPSPQAGSSVLLRMMAGVNHLLRGLDHLLILGTFMLIYGFHRPLVVALTGFTLGHSATLALVGLGWVRAPVATEFLIGLSVLMLAREAANRHGSPTPLASSLMDRHVWLASALIGTCHGLGFASGLAESGPASTLLPALLWFNLGLEFGQLLIVGSFFLVALVAWRLGIGSHARLARISAYGIGAAGAYWTLSRGAVLWSGAAT